MAKQAKKPDFSKKPKFSAFWIIAAVVIGLIAHYFSRYRNDEWE